MDALKFAGVAATPKYRVHLLLFAVSIHAFSDLLKFVFVSLGKKADALHVKFGGKEPEKLTMKDMGDLSKVFSKSNLTPFRVMKGVTFVLALLAEYFMPYFLFGKTTKVMRTNFERQAYSYSPLTLVTCRAPNDPRDFLKSKKELETMMEAELDAEQNFSLNILDFFNSLNDLEDESKEAVQEKLDKQLERDTEKYRDDLKKNRSEMLNLGAFNRFILFIVSKAALHGLYSAVHAMVSPHNHNAFLNSFRKKR